MVVMMMMMMLINIVTAVCLCVRRGRVRCTWACQSVTVEVRT